jgi:hypothetical protein
MPSPKRPLTQRQKTVKQLPDAVVERGRAIQNGVGVREEDDVGAFVRVAEVGTRTATGHVGTGYASTIVFWVALGAGHVVPRANLQH